jgi:RND family efflux transporter MFP subunit
MASASSAIVRRISCPIVFAALLSACGEQNAYVPPPPPKVDVAVPVKQTVTPYLYATGNTAAVNTTTLVARVSGFIQEIDYKDGDTVKEGTKLFVIEPQPYELALEQAQAGQASAAAAAQQSAADYERTDALLKKGVETQQDLDKAAAQKAADAAKQQQADVDVKQAQLNLDYTEVKAPFDGIVTARQVSMGQLVDPGSSTLATVVQLNPIHVSFNVSEQDVQKIRANMMARGVVSLEDLKKIPVEVGLQTDEGYPHQGMLDYASPNLNASTGTLAARAVFENSNRALLPGYFVRVRVPLAEQPDMLLVPDRAIGADQSGRYLLVAGKDDVVEQHTVELGELVGELRVITKGVAADDRVIISGILSAVPGQKVTPEVKALAPPTPAAAPAPAAPPTTAAAPAPGGAAP